MHRTTQKLIGWLFVLLFLPKLPAALAGPDAGPIYDGAWLVYAQNSEEFNCEIHGYSVNLSGCRVFSLTHAAEWLNRERYGPSFILQMAQEMSPNRGPMRTSNRSFAPVLAEKGVYLSDILSVLRQYDAQAVQYSESLLQKAFCDGYVFQYDAGGHFAVAVDYVYCKASDGDPGVLLPVRDSGREAPEGCAMYIQILDSQAASSGGTREDRAFYRQDWYELRQDALVKRSDPLPRDGLQYWVSYQVFSEKLNKESWRFAYDAALRGGKWPGHAVSP